MNKYSIGIGDIIVTNKNEEFLVLNIIEKGCPNKKGKCMQHGFKTNYLVIDAGLLEYRTTDFKMEDVSEFSKIITYNRLDYSFKLNDYKFGKIEERFIVDILKEEYNIYYSIRQNCKLHKIID